MAEHRTRPITRILSLDEIKPYWRNPRRIPPEAVAAVKDSIERYGYQQPIVVDKDNVIVVGHTRLKALQEMGVDTVQVYVTDLPAEKVQEFRVIDNKTSEVTSWDPWALVLELREFDTDLLAAYFPDIDLEVERVNSANAVTQDDIDYAEEEGRKMKEAAVLHLTTVQCPSCFNDFEVRTDSLPGLSQADLQQLNTAAS